MQEPIIDSSTMSDQRINDRYYIKKKLSANAECSIYVAEDTQRFNESCILKEYSKNLAEVQEEASILYQLKHPQIVSFREVFTGISQGKQYTYLVEDYVEGLNYDELLQLYQSQKKDLTEEEVLEKLKQILLVLDVLHSKGIVHGNLSLSSVIEDSEQHKPILVNFSKSRYAPSALTEDISALAKMTKSFFKEDESIPTDVPNLLKAMQEGEFNSARSLLETLETLKLKPVENELTTPISKAEASPKTPSQTGINPVLGCLGKVFLVVGLSLSAGSFGWMGGKYWFSSKNPTPQFTPDLIKKPDEVNKPEVTPSANNNLHERLLSLKISNETFLNSLVDEVFSSRYPEEKNKTSVDLRSTRRDVKTQKKWDEVASEILDHLNTLSPEVLENLGKYTQNDLNRWKLEVNRLHLSSRALYALADGTFYNWFPDFSDQRAVQQKQNFQDQPLGQLRYALAYSQLLSLKAGNNYEKLVTLKPSSKGTLQPGQGKAYSIHLTQGNPLQINLEPPSNILLSIYSPTGKKNLLEDSNSGTWAGILPETGFYEIILISQAKQAIDYELKLNSALPPNR